MHNEVEPTLGLGMRVFWAWFWRSFIFIMLSYIPAVIVMMIFAVPIQLMFGEEAMVLCIVVLSIFYFAFLIGIYGFIYKRLMTKGFGRYRLVVVTKD